MPLVIDVSSDSQPLVDAIICVTGCPKNSKPAGRVIGAVTPSSVVPLIVSVVPPTHASAYVVVPCVIVYGGPVSAKLHVAGATGLAQCYELTHQLRGSAEARQVEGARLALQHNAGLGGATVVTLYGRAD